MHVRTFKNIYEHRRATAAVSPLESYGKLPFQNQDKTHQRSASARFPFSSRAEMWCLGIYGQAIPSRHDASPLGQIKNGLEVSHGPFRFLAVFSSGVISFASLKKKAK